jgi:DNA-binding transcriptional MocR family regulator
MGQRLVKRHVKLDLATLTPGRQDALLDWARRGDCHVLEVDFDSEFHYDGPPPRADPCSGAPAQARMVWHLPGAFPSSVELQGLLRRHGVGVYTLQDRTGSDAEYLDTWAQVLLLGFASQTDQQFDEVERRMARLIR